MQKTPSVGTAFSVEDFFAFEEKADFYISNQGEIYQGADLPKKDPKNPIIVKSHKSSDLNKVHNGYKTLQTETLLLQQKEKALQQDISPLKEKRDALQKINQALLNEIQLLREAKRRREIENRKKKKIRQKEWRDAVSQNKMYLALNHCHEVQNFFEKAEFMKGGESSSYCGPKLKAATDNNADSKCTRQEILTVYRFVSAIKSGDLTQIKKHNLADIRDTNQCCQILDALTEQDCHQDILNLLINELGHSPQKLLFGLIQYFNVFLERSLNKLEYSRKLLSNLINHPKMQAYLNSPYEYFFCEATKITPMEFANFCKCQLAVEKLKIAQKTSSGAREGLNLFTVSTACAEGLAAGLNYFGAEHRVSAITKELKIQK